MTRIVEGSVVRLRCGRCGEPTDSVVFSGDTDMVTAGLVSLASIAHPEVVMAKAASDELVGGSECARLVEHRVSAELGRKDLRFVPLLRAEQQAPVQHRSFQAFRSAYQPPKLIFACPHCETGEASPVTSLSFADYEREGGKLTTVGDLKLAS